MDILRPKDEFVPTIDGFALVSSSFELGGFESNGVMRTA